MTVDTMFIITIVLYVLVFMFSEKVHDEDQ
jgi:hypothetical protein